MQARRGFASREKKPGSPPGFHLPLAAESDRREAAEDLIADRLYTADPFDLDVLR
jgi:hypothetical protein